MFKKIQFLLDKGAKVILETDKFKRIETPTGDVAQIDNFGRCNWLANELGFKIHSKTLDREIAALNTDN